MKKIIKNLILLSLGLFSHSAAHADVAMGDMHKMFGDYDKAIIEYQKAAAEGNTHAMYNLGFLHEQGLGTEVNLENAYNHYVSAAQEGHLDAIHAVGMMHKHGRHVDPDMNKAFRFFELAASRDHLESLYDMAVIQIVYSDDPAQNQTGIKNLIQAADDGHDQAGYELYRNYKVGHLVKKNLAEGLKYLIRSADNYHGDSAFDLAGHYGQGDGLDTDLEKSHHYMLTAARTGHVEAAYGAAMMFELGIGTPKNPARAAVWYYIAAEKNPDKFKAFYDEAVAKLNAAQRAEMEQILEDEDL